MKLREALQSYTVTHLKELVGVSGGPGPEGNRKEQLVRYLYDRLTHPDSLAQLWDGLDELSKKAVAAAYHGDGRFNEEAFLARHGDLPGRRGGDVFYDLAEDIMFGYRREPAVLDLFLHRSQLPRELMDPLAPLVPPPEKFLPEGLVEAPGAVEIDGETLPLWRADTEEAGPHDLAAYLRLYVRDELRGGSTSDRMSPTGAGNLLANLLDGDFLVHGERVRPADTIRPSGLDWFVRQSGLAHYYRGRRRLTDAGEALLRHQDPETLLDAFETWAGGSSDELGRIKALKGINAKRTHLSPPAERREAIIEALSWCPVGVWISTDEFYRALLIWEFDIELDRGYESNLSVEHPFYGRVYYLEREGRTLIETLYMNAVLMESLGSIGALDLLYLPPGDAGRGDDSLGSYYSLHDGLTHFRVNPLGAYLLGQAAEYAPPRRLDAPLFTIDPSFALTLEDPESLTPNLRDQLHQLAVEEDAGHYRLDTQTVLGTLDSGEDLRHLADFLAGRHEGPLPEQVTDWLEEIGVNSKAFRHTGDALFIKVLSQALVQMILEDPALGKFAKALEARTLVIPSNKERAFRKRLKELGYLLSR